MTERSKAFKRLHTLIYGKEPDGLSEWEKTSNLMLNACVRIELREAELDEAVTKLQHCHKQIRLLLPSTLVDSTGS